MRMVAPNEILGTNLGLWDIQWWYNIVRNSNYDTYYLKVRRAKKRFMLNMPDNRGDELDLLHVTSVIEPIGEDGQVFGMHYPHAFRSPRTSSSF